MGDMNIDMLKYGSNDRTDVYIDGIFSKGFLPRILKPTRLTHTSATLIDHILTNDITVRSSSGIIINDIADHFAVFHISTSNKKNTKPPIKYTRIISDKNLSNFRSELDIIDFSQTLSSECPNEAYTMFF